MPAGDTTTVPAGSPSRSRRSGRSASVTATAWSGWCVIQRSCRSRSTRCCSCRSGSSAESPRPWRRRRHRARLRDLAAHRGHRHHRRVAPLRLSLPALRRRRPDRQHARRGRRVAPRRARRTTAARRDRASTTISYGRRLVGMVCDVLFVVLLGAAVVVPTRVRSTTASRRRTPTSTTGCRPGCSGACPRRSRPRWCWSPAGPSGSGGVDPRRRPTTEPRPRLPAVKLAVGVGPFLALGVLTPAWSTWALLGYLAVTALAALPTPSIAGCPTHRRDGPGDRPARLTQPAAP